MIKRIPRDWHMHGSFAQTELIAGVLHSSGAHFLTGADVPAKDAVLAYLAVAAASNVVTCGLSAPDKNGARASLAGFFGLATGASTGVAIITGSSRAEALDRSVEVNALSRGISQAVPVAVMGVNGVGAHALTAAHARIAELEKWFDKERGVGLGLVILDGLSLPIGEVLAFQRPDRAVLCIGDAPGGVARDGVIIEVGDNHVTLAKPASGEPVAWEFTLDVVKVQDNETLVLKPGKAVEPQPIWCAAPPVAVAPVAKEPELPIVSRVALIVSRGEVSPKVRERWSAEGFIIAASEAATLPRPGEITGGKREIVISGEDQLPTELRARATRLCEEAVRRGVIKDIVVRVAA